MKEDWISQDIKAIVDSEVKPFSRERQGRIQFNIPLKEQIIDAPKPLDLSLQYLFGLLFS